jgi:phosphohistidine phosphatase
VFLKRIWIMRHAKSDWSSPELSDFERPLNKRGKRNAPSMGKWMRKTGQSPDLIVSSPAERARQTVQLVCRQLGAAVSGSAGGGYEGAIEWWEEMYPGIVQQTIEHLKNLGADAKHVLLVGHNPHMERLVSALVSEGSLRVRLPTASIAVLHSDIENWQELEPATTELRGLVTPRLLAL